MPHSHELVHSSPGHALRNDHCFPAEGGQGAAGINMREKEKREAIAAAIDRTTAKVEGEEEVYYYYTILLVRSIFISIVPIILREVTICA